MPPKNIYGGTSMTNDVNYILENQSAIEKKIAFQFNFHKKLLIQAFTRKSFAEENEGYEDNEILEFYGDQLVNTVMTKWLYDSFKPNHQIYADEYFYSSKDEAELTKIRSNYINRSALAHCIDILDLDGFLLLSKSDEKNEVWKSEKVRCDLFEAIIGAIAVATNWDFNQIEKSCKAMWGMLDFNENYINSLYDSCESLDLPEPEFRQILSFNSQYSHNFSVKLQNRNFQKTFEGSGTSEINAKMEAAKKALEYLHIYQIEQMTEMTTLENAVQTLNNLYLKKLISKPDYNFSVSADENGNQIWRCECYITDFENWEGYDEAGIGKEASKSEAKQSAAYDMICFMIGKQNKSRIWICPSCGGENSYEDSICKICYEGERIDD